MNTEDKERCRDVYKEEVYELLDQLEIRLLELEKKPGDIDLVNSVFRSLHTIKGSGAMFGFDRISEFTHEIEKAFDRVRHGEMAVTSELVNSTLAAGDRIKAMLDNPDGGAEDDIVAKEILQSIEALMPETTDREAENPWPVISACRSEARNAIFHVGFRPPEHLFANGTNPILLFRELAENSDCITSARTDAIPLLKDIDPEVCYTSWDILLHTRQGVDSIKDTFIFVEDDSEIVIEKVDETDEPLSDTDFNQLGKMLVKGEGLPAGELQKVIASRFRNGEKTRTQAAGREPNPALSMRVTADKLDAFVDLVGEMVTVQARLSRKAALYNDEELDSIAEDVGRLVGRFRDNTMRIRMLPISNLFKGRFKRLVHDLAIQLGKEAVLKIEGEETELDKTVLEQLNDPLLHIIRNSMDHGIELPEIRDALGKPKQGTITISAEHRGADVMIRISDDGKGLDPETIRARAVENGFLDPDTELSGKEAFNLIFIPGFSTTREINGVSGRGVGMDVVKRCIEGLRGHVEVSSRRSVGTAITLKLPLTLAIIDGLLVRIGFGDFVIPISLVEECVKLHRKDADRAGERSMMDFRGKPIPYLNLRELFLAGGEPPAVQHVVITEANGKHIGYGIDRVIGEHQTVIKPLGKAYHDSRVITGATILGDGSVALILDVSQIHRNLGSFETGLAGIGNELN